MKNNYRFIAVLEQENDTYGVYFPDLDGCVTGGNTVDEAIENAKEVLKLHIFTMEQDGDIIPEPCDLTSLKLASNEIPIITEVYMKAFREKMNERFIKKTLSIPNWLNTEAEQRGINFSKTLQNALINELHL